MIPYGRQYIDCDDVQAVVDVLHSEIITQGQKVKEFENAICAYTDAKYAVVVSSGTAALHCAAAVCNLAKGDEVITSPITFVASANCALYCGASPVFVDIDAETITLACDQLEQAITPYTKIIIPVHFAGHPAELAAIYTIARRYNIIVIEDAAHALGARYGAGMIGSCEYSDMTVFSFHPVKHITTGEGGAITTNNKELYDRLIAFRAHGIIKDVSCLAHSDGPWYYEQQFLGFNYRLTDFQCALGISQLKKLERFISLRQNIVKKYEQSLVGIDGLRLPEEKRNVRSAWHLYPVRVRDAKMRKYVFTRMREKGIGVQVHYIPVYKQPYYQHLGYSNSLCPHAEKFYNCEISLPIYPALSDEEIETVIRVFKETIEAYDEESA